MSHIFYVSTMEHHNGFNKSHTLKRHGWGGNPSNVQLAIKILSKPLCPLIKHCPSLSSFSQAPSIINRKQLYRSYKIDISHVFVHYIPFLCGADEVPLKNPICTLLWKRCFQLDTSLFSWKRCTDWMHPCPILHLLNVQHGAWSFRSWMPCTLVAWRHRDITLNVVVPKPGGT